MGAVTDGAPSSAAAARAAAAVLRGRIGDAVPAVAVMLGSGLGGVADAVGDAVRIPYIDVPGLPAVGVAGHAGVLVSGVLDGVRVLVFSGRFHLYEGHTAAQVAYPVRIAHALGARTLIVSSAMGAIDPRFAPGDLMLVADHLNLTGASPLTGAVQEGDVRFPDLSDAYDARLRETVRAVARRLGIPLSEGVYASLLGPSYETPAEIRMLRTLGAHAVCMSAAMEVIVARAVSMRVCGIGCITNVAAGMGRAALDHRDVLRATGMAAERFQGLVRGVIAGRPA